LWFMFTGDPTYVKEDSVKYDETRTKEPVEISRGGWAGIVCGLLFLLSVTMFIVIAVRKK